MSKIKHATSANPNDSVTGTFTPSLGLLEAAGACGDDAIVLGRDAAGNILLNGGASPILGGTPTVANTTSISASGRGGDDTITLDETNGALPSATLFGGDGDDTITGGSGNDLLFGQAGNDTLLGQGGADQLFGGAGDDVLAGGDGDDGMFGGAGNDRMIWNPGDDNDVMEGGAGADTAEINGGGGAETFTAAANGARVLFDRVDPAPFNVDIGTTESLVVNMNDGDDSFSAAGDLSALIKLTVDGGAGNDTINGGNGADVLLGGDGDDFIDGNQGADVAFLGAGDDLFQWDPGDGSDVVEGQDGADTMLFNGSDAAENFDASANGGRLRFFRDVGNIVMDTDDVETIELNALGGADNVVVGDLSGTDVAEVRIDLGATAGASGDGSLDAVTATGTDAADAIVIDGAAGEVAVTGLTAAVRVLGGEADGTDRLIVNGLGGDDVIDATGLAAGGVDLELNGGLGADLFLGSEGGDFVNGGDGDDVALMGAGDDTFVWNPGDDNDTLEGQDGFDTMLFNGANVAENIDISANGGRALFFRDVANVTMDSNDLERIEFNALGGADNIVVNDLSGTDVTEVAIDLAVDGAGDEQADNVIANATNGDDVAQVFGDGAGLSVRGLAARTDVTGAEGALDTLTINGFAGDDVIDASGVAAGAVQLVLDGGDGDDVIIGSDGDDVLRGGAGDDVLLGGLGNDIIDGGDGDDIEIQGFVAGAATDDAIDFRGRGFTFDWLLANTSDVGSDAVLDLGDQQFTLRGVSTSELHQDDFLLS